MSVKLSRITGLALLVLPLLAACSSSGSSSSTTPTSLRMSSASVSVAAGQSASLLVSAVLSNGSTNDVTAAATWSSSDSTIATVAGGSVKGVKKGAATITATSGALSATASVTVTDATLSTIAVTPATPSIAKGLSQQLAATGTFSDASSHDISATATWSTSNAAVASVSATGLVQGVSAGSATITATSNGVSATAQITVTAATVTSLAVGPSGQSIAAGATAQFTATATFTDSSTADVSAQATWTTSDANTATVSGRTVTGVAAGNATISASYQGKSGGVQVSVANITAIAVTPAVSTLVEGHSAQLTATATLDNNSAQDVTQSASWSSANPGAALVSMDPGTRGVVTGAGTGSSPIAAAIGGATGNATVNVTNLALTATVPTFQNLTNGVITMNAVASTLLPPATPVMWQVTLTTNAPSGSFPTSNQSVFWYGGAQGEDPANPSTWVTTAKTDANGVVVIGPANGTPASQTGLTSDAGQSLAFRTQYAIKGSYSMSFALFDMTLPASPANLGVSATMPVTVGTIAIADTGELLLVTRSPGATLDNNNPSQDFPQAYTIHPDGTNQKLLTPFQAANYAEPRDDVSEFMRSPDGKFIVWVDGRDRQGGIYFDGEVYIANADGSNARRLTGADPSLCKEVSLNISPDSKLITFDRVCSSGSPFGQDDTEYEYIINADGTNEKLVAVHGINDIPFPGVSWPVVFATFSNDSKTLYAVAYMAAGNALWAYDIASGSATKLVDYSTSAELASISKFVMVMPNGNLLYHYINNKDGQTWLEEINADGSNRQLIRPIETGGASGRLLEDEFTLSPDGTKVACDSYDPVNNYDIVEVSNLDGTNPEFIGTPTYFIRRVIWSPAVKSGN
jgi:uncharacterized protein YjdB